MESRQTSAPSKSRRARRALAVLLPCAIALIAAACLFRFLQPAPCTADFFTGREIRLSGWRVDLIDSPACVFYSDKSPDELARQIGGYEVAPGPSGLLLTRQSAGGEAATACLIAVPESVLSPPACWLHNLSASFRAPDGSVTVTIPLPYHRMASSAALDPFRDSLSLEARYAVYASFGEVAAFYRDLQARYGLSGDSLTVEQNAIVLRGAWVKDAGETPRCASPSGTGRTAPFPSR